MKKIFLLLFFALTVGSLQLFSQATVPSGNKVSESTATPKNNIIIKGSVIDSLTSETIAFATLRIVEADKPEKIVKLLSTDERGNFQIALNNTGKFLLHIQYVGKSAPATPFEIKPSDKLIDLGQINVKDNLTLEETVVTAVRPLVAVDLDKITYRTQDDPDSKTSNVLDMMRKVPMVTLDAEEKIQLKGSSNFKIYLDGKPSDLISNNPTQILKSMPASTIKSIEVITDPGAKYDAEGVAGIINIMTDKQSMNGYTVNVSAGAATMGAYNAGVNTSVKFGKLGVTASYNYYRYKNPTFDYESFRESYTSDTYKYLTQNGTNAYEGTSQNGYLQLSYEIDTFNLISASINRFGNDNNGKSDLMVDMQNSTYQDIYKYHQQYLRNPKWVGTGFNVDYQKSFRKKDELLTMSYRYNLTSEDMMSETAIDSILNRSRSLQKLDNNADNKEHTAQIDYTTPLAKIHTIEGGVKYIFRLNESNGDQNYYDYHNLEWKHFVTPTDRFKYRYDILAAYLGYSLRLKDYGFKAGLRGEETLIKAEFPLDNDMNFDTDYFTLVPSTAITYKINPLNSLRLGYNMRIQRPGIWYLNPYINNTDPKYITQGNPNLDVEKANNVSLNYSMFSQKVNINANLSYNFTNNSIQRVTTMERDISYTTYENIGKQNQTSLDVYVNWNPSVKLRFYLNGSIGYTDIRSNNETNISNHGFNEQAFLNVQYTFPYDFMLTAMGAIRSPQINLQGETSGMFMTNFGLSKSFLKKKLNISLMAINPFSKYITLETKQWMPDFQAFNKNDFPIRNFRIRVSYQFGEMKKQIQKVRRGISNDDIKAKEEQNQGGTGNIGGGQ